MLRPSYAELIEVLNSDSAANTMITSRYTIVIAAAKRARQLIDGQDPLTYAPTDKAVSIAINEMHSSKIRVVSRRDKESSIYDELESAYEAYLESTPGENE